MELTILNVLKGKTKEDAIKTIENAKTPQELIAAVYTLELNNVDYASKKGEYDLYSKNIKSFLKEYETKINELETLIKNKFLEVYQEAEVLVQKRQFNPDTQTWEAVKDEQGNDLLKTKQVNNKGEGVFIYSPETKTMERDLSKVSYETHPHLYTLQPVLDMGLVRLDETIPMKEVIKPASVGIQHAKLQKQLNQELEFVRKQELAKIEEQEKEEWKELANANNTKQNLN